MQRKINFQNNWTSKFCEVFVEIKYFWKFIEGGGVIKLCRITFKKLFMRLLVLLQVETFSSIFYTTSRCVFCIFPDILTLFSFFLKYSKVTTWHFSERSRQPRVYMVLASSSWLFGNYLKFINTQLLRKTLGQTNVQKK